VVDQYSKQADVWSVGVLAFMLVSSQMPFYGRKRAEIVEQIIAGKCDFKGRRWKRASAQSKEFIKDLLVVNPDERVTADEALGATWLTRRNGATVRNPFQEEIDRAHQSMLDYSRYSKLKRVALMIIAHKSTSDEIGILRKMFQKYDIDGSGSLSYDEFKNAIDDADYSEGDCRKIFDALVRRKYMLRECFFCLLVPHFLPYCVLGSGR
jgi:calcium-dependent protein kinase